MSITMHESRHKILHEEFSKSYFAEIQQTLEDKKTAGEVIFPESENIFAAYDLCPLDDLKVVILGQDPYHGIWQAHGLSFSVREWVKLPPSLKNIFKEIEIDIPSPPTPLPKGEGSLSSEKSGDLTRRAEQWAFLLNSVLTVSQWQPGSHSKIGRQEFTDATIRAISNYKDWVAFLLRGNFAKSKKDLIDRSKHLVLESSHPSPLSAYSWFFGCKHFSQTNAWLQKQWMEPIKW